MFYRFLSTVPHHHKLPPPLPPTLPLPPNPPPACSDIKRKQRSSGHKNLNKFKSAKVKCEACRILWAWAVIIIKPLLFIPADNKLYLNMEHSRSKATLNNFIPYRFFIHLYSFSQVMSVRRLECVCCRFEHSPWQEHSTQIPLVLLPWRVVLDTRPVTECSKPVMHFFLCPVINQSHFF